MNIHPHNEYILCTRYERPATTESGVHLGQTTDMSGTLWDVVRFGPKALGVLGIETEDKVILETPPDAATYVGYGMFIVSAYNVLAVIPWRNDEHE